MTRPTAWPDAKDSGSTDAGKGMLSPSAPSPQGLVRTFTEPVWKHIRTQVRSPSGAMSLSSWGLPERKLTTRVSDLLMIGWHRCYISMVRRVMSDHSILVSMGHQEAFANQQRQSSYFLIFGPWARWTIPRLQRKPQVSVDTNGAGDPVEAVMWRGPERVKS